MADFGSSNNRDPACEACRIGVSGVAYSSDRTSPAARLGRSLSVVRPDILAPYHRRIGAEVLLYRTPAAILDRGAPLDDASD